VPKEDASSVQNKVVPPASLPADTLVGKQPDLLGAESQAEADTASELKQQGNEKFKDQKYEDALMLYGEAVLLTPRDASLWLNRSICCRNLEEWDDAVEAADLAIELDPGNVKAHYSLALALKGAGKLYKSLQACSTALQQHPDNKALQQLKKLVKHEMEKKNRYGDVIVSQPHQEEVAAGEQQLEDEVNGEEAKLDEAQEVPGGPTVDEEINEDDIDVDSGKAPPMGRKKLKSKASKRRERVAAAERAVVQEENTPKPPSRQIKAAQPVSPKAIDPNSCPVSRIEQDKEMELIKEKARAQMYSWNGKNPPTREREAYKHTLTQAFMTKYRDLKEESKSLQLDTNLYQKEQKNGLQLTGGHRPMARPKHVELPANYKTPLGTISIDELKQYTFANPDRRYLISVYGNVFDVSDRPDKYGPDGPYTILTGADITWGLFAGVDTMDYVNRCYDLFKAKDMGKDKIAGVCSWLAWYWTEYGDPVAQLEPYTRESELPPPPLQEVDETCTVM